MLYSAALKHDDDTILVQFPDVPEAITFGIDSADARERAKEALAVALSMYVEQDKPLPVASRAMKGHIPIPLPAVTVAKLALYTAMREQRITKTELARRLDCHRQHVDRILDPARHTRFEVLENALELVGKRASLVIEDAA